MRLFLPLFLALACSGGKEPPTTDAATAEKTFGGARPLDTLRVPGSYDGKKPVPLVLVLHGYGVSGLLQSIYLGLSSLVEEKGFILAAPDGTLDSKGRRFWSALNLIGTTGPDDVKYLLGLIDELTSYYAIDKKRIYLVGHSNGSAMSYNLACVAADRFAAIVSLGGTFYTDASKCKPSSAVAVREMHGTKDEVLPYEGGAVSLPTSDGTVMLPSAPFIAESWSKYNGCTMKVAGTNVDADLDQPGAETTVTRYTGCKPNGDVELWSMEGTIHVPFNLSRDTGRMIWSFLEAHPKS
jgi:polyhydroxybutyrate depolymerase